MSNEISIEGCSDNRIIYEEIYKRAMELKEAYEEIYGVRPTCLKIPLCLYHKLLEFITPPIYDCIPEYFYNLKLCPTKSIHLISEMEVF